MAAPYKKTVIKTHPKISEKVTSDTLYWKNLEFPITKKESGAVSHVEFSPVKPYHYAVTSSAKVTIYNSRTNEVIRTISRFRDTAYCGSFRSDGRLLVAGGDEGVIRLFDTNTKSLLRVFKGHTGPVHVCKFTRDNLHIVSGSDDKSVRIYDVPTESEVACFREHQVIVSD
ncbi:hypothetical protein NP493_261g01018 [Ridgeia piscesae]|uniref:U3 small nucleolar RNA-associated protein 15 n=1 Tax=Ridgeia piscesae TaxID=27915 RepID=A0AAD9UCR3_RIDPI|nr:hypothetical protein NP493_261g01018 [Ridgeia piscesae]